MSWSLSHNEPPSKGRALLHPFYNVLVARPEVRLPPRFLFLVESESRRLLDDAEIWATSGPLAAPAVGWPHLCGDLHRRGKSRLQTESASARYARDTLSNKALRTYEDPERRIQGGQALLIERIAHRVVLMALDGDLDAFTKLAIGSMASRARRLALTSRPKYTFTGRYRDIRSKND